MFTVDIESVMYATGARKDQRFDDSRDEDDEDEDEDDAEEEDEEADEEEVAEEEEEEVLADDAPELVKTRKTALKDIRTKIADLEKDEHTVGKRKRELRVLRKECRQMMTRVTDLTENDIGDFSDRLEAVVMKIKKREALNEAEARTLSPTPAPASVSVDVDQQDQIEDAETHLARLSLMPNMRDPSKPYLTPWRPRDYMAPFAFIPRYLEVNHNICSAVYLRHPRVRPGNVEVPTPFHTDTGALAFAWYLRRR
jgi:hypothetical protein